VGLVRFALRNPHAVVVMSLTILLIGVTSFTRTPADILPTFKTPAVQILTLYPGMPAEVMEADITTRLERWTGQSNGVARQESKSMVGVSVVRDYFRPDIDPNTAMSQVTSLAMSDLYVSTSQHEGFGLVFVEGMAAGLPVVCYDHGGQTDFLESGRTGYVVPLNDLEAFGQRCRELIDDQALRRRMGEENRRRAEPMFADQCAKQYEALFEQVVASHQGAGNGGAA